MNKHKTNKEMNNNEMTNETQENTRVGESAQLRWIQHNSKDQKQDAAGE